MEIKHSVLTVKEQKEVILDGVINIEGFDESYVLIKTNSGKITLEGTGLKIESLTKESGVIVVSGKVLSVTYDESKGGSGFFGRLFK